ncbi:MAG: family 1 extracellular solute-binding protein [Paenibacillaceae bacterium]|jgi:putative aldouronate transport system substrate-binding protein|nr:family 1 extracellular solute-binding protein [Paenibacillaceae bacterium]
MKKNIWVAIPLAAVVALGSVMAGCAKEEDKTNTGEAGQETKKDITVSIYDRGIIAQDEGTVESNRWTNWVNANGPANVKFVAIPRTNPAEKINVLFASGSAPDLLFEFAPSIRNPLYEQKQLMPIDDLIEKYSVDYKKLINEYPVLKKVGTKSDGKLYEFGRLAWVEPARGFLIRTDWLKKLNLEAPKTTEELYNVAKAFTEQDPDGNGKKDTFGLTVSGNAELTMRQVFGSSSKWVLKNDQLVPNWDEQTDYYGFVKRLYDEGMIDRDFSMDKNGAKAKQDFINGKIGIYPFLDTSSMSIIQNLIDPLKKNVASADVTFFAYPKSKAGAFIPTVGNPVQMVGVVSATAKNPDSVMKFVDFIVRESTMQTLQYGVEGTHYKLTDGVPEIMDAAKHKKEVGDITVDMRMLHNTALEFGKADLPLVKYKNDPRKQEYQNFYELYRKTYLTLDKSYPELTVSQHMPAPPKNLATSETNAEKAMTDIWMKAVVSGDKYTIQQAVQDAQDNWRKGDGKEIEEWYKNWYTTNKDNTMLPKDIYEIIKQQNEELDKIIQEAKK